MLRLNIDLLRGLLHDDPPSLPDLRALPYPPSSMHCGRRFAERIMQLAVVCGPLSVLLAACGTPYTPYPADKPWDAGWRYAHIQEFDGGAAFTTPVKVDCRQELAGQAFPDTRFALVEYVHGRSHRHRIVLVKNSDQFQPGDNVYFKHDDCAQAVVRN
jgi:hypothetical protein